MEFQFNKQEVAQNIIDIEDLGNVAIEGTNSFGDNYYLIIKTIMGRTRILKYGPINLDISEPPEVVICEYSRMIYNFKKLSKIITLFLNNYQYGLINSKVIDINEALDNCRDMRDFIKEDN